MKPSTAISDKKDLIHAIVTRYRVSNPRVFGSAVLGTDKEGSDLDLLVDTLPGTTLFDLGGLQMELEEQLGIHIDLRTPDDLPPYFRSIVLSQARPV